MDHRHLSSFPRLPESSVSSATNAQDLIMPTLSLASAAPPPPTPHPWIWTCHSCRMVYSLGCTRRCIECGHTMCTSRDVAAVKLEAAMGSSSGGSGRRAGKQRRRRRRGPCVSEFDFAGWEAWAAWRRGLQSRQGQGQSQDREREQRFADGKHSCPDDCSYPSECHHTRRRLLREQHERSIVQWIAERYGSTGPGFLSPKPKIPATTAMAVSGDEGTKEKSDEALLSVAAGEFYIELPDETGHDDSGEAETLPSSVLIAVDPDEIHSLDDNDNDSDDSDDSDPHDTGLTTTLAQSDSWPLPAARDQLTFTMLSGGNNNSSSSSSSATPEDEEMHDIPSSLSPGDEGYDSDIDEDDNDDDDDDDEDNDPSYLAVADRQRRSQRELYRLTGSGAFLPLSTRPTSALAPSRNPRSQHCYQLPSLAEEEEDDDDDDDDEDEDSEINWPSQSSPSHSPPTTRSSSRAGGGDGRAFRWSPREPAAGSTNEDIAELMRFRSAFMRGEL